MAQRIIKTHRFGRTIAWLRAHPVRAVYIATIPALFAVVATVSQCWPSYTDQKIPDWANQNMGWIVNIMPWWQMWLCIAGSGALYILVVYFLFAPQHIFVEDGEPDPDRPIFVLRPSTLTFKGYGAGNSLHYRCDIAITNKGKHAAQDVEGFWMMHPKSFNVPASFVTTLPAPQIQSEEGLTNDHKFHTKGEQLPPQYITFGMRFRDATTKLQYESLHLLAWDGIDDALSLVTGEELQALISKNREACLFINSPQSARLLAIIENRIMPPALLPVPDRAAPPPSQAS